MMQSANETRGMRKVGARCGVRGGGVNNARWKSRQPGGKRIALVKNGVDGWQHRRFKDRMDGEKPQKGASASIAAAS